MKKILVLLFTLCSIAYGQTAVSNTDKVQYEYIVFKSSLTRYNVPISSFAVGNKNIGEAGGQPFLITRIVPARCTNYYYVYITTNAQKDNTFLNNTTIKKYYYRTAKHFVTYINGILKSNWVQIRPYPNDINRDYSIHESTP